jgi:hypothetical protein
MLSGMKHSHSPAIVSRKLDLLASVKKTVIHIAAGCLLVLVGASGFVAASASDNPAADPHTIPVIDGGIGPCSATFTVKDAAGVPIYNSRIRVHISYGFIGAHKLDLEVGANIDGKARFTGLPNRVKQPMQFKASEGDREGEATVDPASGCRAQLEIVLKKTPADPNQP